MTNSHLFSCTHAATKSRDAGPLLTSTVLVSTSGSIATNTDGKQQPSILPAANLNLEMSKILKNYNNWNEVPAAEVLYLIDNIDSHGVYKEAFFTERGFSSEMAGVHYLKAGTGKDALYANVDGEVVSIDGMTGITGMEIAFNICQALGVNANYSDARGRGRILEAHADALREHFGATNAS